MGGCAGGRVAEVAGWAGGPLRWAAWAGGAVPARRRAARAAAGAARGQARGPGGAEPRPCARPRPSAHRPSLDASACRTCQSWTRRLALTMPCLMTSPSCTWGEGAQTWGLRGRGGRPAREGQLAPALPAAPPPAAPRSTHDVRHRIRQIAELGLKHRRQAARVLLHVSDPQVLAGQKVGLVEGRGGRQGLAAEAAAVAGASTCGCTPARPPLAGPGPARTTSASSWWVWLLQGACSGAGAGAAAAAPAARPATASARHTERSTGAIVLN